MISTDADNDDKLVDEAEEMNLSPTPAAAAADPAFSTPEAKEHQIPKPITCPPAPLRAPGKRRLSRSAIRDATKKFRAARDFLLSPEMETGRRTPKHDLRSAKHFR
ncbi:unnamed protein product [Linum trigynum]|uniref:Uncharacterized protein n=1 Tax=Linum trigynum TaxID=586398 RepID=A0AAV2G472_9ROSI